MGYEVKEILCAGGSGGRKKHTTPLCGWWAKFFSEGGQISSRQSYCVNSVKSSRGNAIIIQNHLLRANYTLVWTAESSATRVS